MMTSLSRAELASKIASEIAASSEPGARLARLLELAPGPAVFTTSFGLEDQVLTHVIAALDLPVELVTLDTGRLFQETIALWAATERRYGLKVRAFLPDAAQLQALISQWGVDGFRSSVEARLACCHVRKVVPLSTALAEARIWITGLRASQSPAREQVRLAEWDETHALIKVSPLADWSRPAVIAFAQKHDLPLNELHAKGFASIGCAPCTRALAPGEPERAGRWWWEAEGKKECGLHLRPPPAGLSAPA